MAQDKGYIYLIRSNLGYFKIGKSVDPAGRLSALKAGNPVQLEIVHLIDTTDMSRLETGLHRHYGDRRVYGEWFNLTEQDLAEICAISRVDYSPRNDTSIRRLGHRTRLDIEPIGNTFAAYQISDSDIDLTQVELHDLPPCRPLWRIEKFRNGQFWQWRKGSGSHRLARYDGIVRKEGDA